MASLILGTAGHIDHGKTALVKALTGTDTDRLDEEKARGITIELGFAELAVDDRVRFGVVDVPGHEGFVRAMVAGAAGMDVVLLVVAADEGVMPQTREHLAIVELLGVREVVVALTKCDLVEAEWLDLVEAEVAETLAPTPFASAPLVRTSATKGEGLDELVDALCAAADRVASEEPDDLARLPLDRVFTIRGTGTVVTGTLWSGEIRADERVRILPGDLAARVRSLQVHGSETERARAGQRTAVALTGEGSDRELVARGSTLVTDPSWTSTWMLTVRVRVVGDSGWSVEHNQRVHIHLGTAEVLARVALLEDASLLPGDSGWMQLRLEAPLVARARDRFVIRSYSPVTTIGGGMVAESHPPKRTALGEAERRALATSIEGEPAAAVAASLKLAGWEGVGVASLPVRTGMAPDVVSGALEALEREGCLRAGAHVFGRDVAEEARKRVLAAVDAEHEEDPLLTSVPLSSARAGLPSWAPGELADAALERLVGEGALESVDGGVRRTGHETTLTPEQEDVSRRLRELFGEAGLAAPLLDEFPPDLMTRNDFRPLIRRLEESGEVRQVAERFFVATDELSAAEERIRVDLGGRSALGPADFRDALPVTRKHLIPLLNYFDGRGVTVRTDEGRNVPAGNENGG